MAVSPNVIEAPASVVAAKLKQRIPALDGLRGVASIMVVFYHFGPQIASETGSAFRLLRGIPAFWLQGVTLFFVLSGFLISGILVGERTSSRYFHTFYKRRAFRIFPLYYLVFLSYCVALAVLGTRTTHMGLLFADPLPLWPYVLYFQNFVMTAVSSYGPHWMAGSWSLAVEEQFYFTLPAIIRFTSDRILFRLTVAAIIGAPLLRASIQKFRYLPQLANYMLLPTCVDSLAVGVLVMLLLKTRRAYLESRVKQIRVGLFAAFVCWSVYPYVPNPQAVRMAFLERTITSLLFGGLLLLVLIAPTGRIAMALARQGMRMLGNMAYSTYLFHPILLCVAFAVIRGKDPTLVSTGDLWPLIAAASLTVALSLASWKLFESKLIRIGHRFQY